MTRSTQTRPTSRTAGRAALRAAAALATLLLPLTLSACDDEPVGPGNAAPSPISSAPTKPFGAGCDQVPTTGPGSFSAMASQPFVTASANNPLVGTMVTWIRYAALTDELDQAPAITVFAPSDAAFEAMDAEVARTAFADPSGKLADLIRGHVVEGRLDPAQIAGTHPTLNGGEIVVNGSGAEADVAGGRISCGGIRTANATVYVVDKVLLPAG